MKTGTTALRASGDHLRTQPKASGVLRRGSALALRTALAWSQVVTGQRLSILIFHRVLCDPDPIFPREINAQRFVRLMRLVRATFSVLPLDDAIRLLDQGRLPPRALAITFDDGYADNHEVAAPILRDLGLPATVFVTTGCLEGGRMWNDSVIECIRRSELASIDLSFLGLPVARLCSWRERRSVIEQILPIVKYRNLRERQCLVNELHHACGKPSLPEDLMMSHLQVRALAGMGVAIGAHTINHPILQSVDDGEAVREISGGRAELERITGQQVTLFAYPNGRPGVDYDDRHVDLVRRLGFVGAVSTAGGHNGPGTDLFQLRRFTPWDASDVRWIGRLAWSHGFGRAS